MMSLINPNVDFGVPIVQYVLRRRHALAVEFINACSDFKDHGAVMVATQRLLHKAGKRFAQPPIVLGVHYDGLKGLLAVDVVCQGLPRRTEGFLPPRENLERCPVCMKDMPLPDECPTYFLRQTPDSQYQQCQVVCSQACVDEPLSMGLSKAAWMAIDKAAHEAMRERYRGPKVNEVVEHMTLGTETGIKYGGDLPLPIIQSEFDFSKPEMRQMKAEDVVTDYEKVKAAFKELHGTPINQWTPVPKYLKGTEQITVAATYDPIVKADDVPVYEGPKEEGKLVGSASMRTDGTMDLVLDRNRLSDEVNKLLFMGRPVEQMTFGVDPAKPGEDKTVVEVMVMPEIE